MESRSAGDAGLPSPEEAGLRPGGDLTRRDLLKAAATAAAATPLVSGDRLLAAVAAPTSAPKFFTRAQYALVDELTEMLIPADEHSGGARAAGVVAYIDSRLAEAVESEPKHQFLAGLARVDQIARETKGGPFMSLTPADREAIVTAMAAEEKTPKSEEGKFFVELKRHTVRGYYTSKIGIHDEMEYKGNVMQEEYAGIDVSKGV
jgi:Gluconate 2-dehydrogenase subunit 3